MRRDEKILIYVAPPPTGAHKIEASCRKYGLAELRTMSSPCSASTQRWDSFSTQFAKS
jgi:hypothetical protein